MMMKKQEHNLIVTSVRIEEKKHDLAIEHEINLSELLREALDKELLKKLMKCPTCKRKVK